MPAWLVPEYVGYLEYISGQLLYILQPSARLPAAPALLVSFNQC